MVIYQFKCREQGGSNLVLCYWAVGIKGKTKRTPELEELKYNSSDLGTRQVLRDKSGKRWEHRHHQQWESRFTP